MRIAFVTHDGDLYGSNRSLVNLIEGLKEYDVQSHVIMPRQSPLSAVLSSMQIPIMTLPIANWTSPRIQVSGRMNRLRHVIYKRQWALDRLRQNVAVLPRLKEQLQAWNIDVVHTNVSVTPIGAMSARLIRRPHVWHLREFNDLDFDYEYDWGRRLSRFLIKRATAKIAISQAIARYYRLNTSAGTEAVIYNGVASERKYDRLRAAGLARAKSRTRSEFTFCLVGKIHPTKGQEDAIRAVSLLIRDGYRVRLIVAGGGNDQRLHALAAELRVSEQVEFWGHLDDSYRAYFSSDAALMCSKSEAMGRVTVEAMSASIPVIGYDNAGTSEIIQHERTGLLYRGGPEALAACMARFTDNRPWTLELGTRAWTLARERFSTESYAREVYGIFRTVSENRWRDEQPRTTPTEAAS